MGVRSKTLVTVLLVGVVVGAFVLTTRNTELFKGLIFNQNDTGETVEVEELLPDLVVDLKVTPPEIEGGDLVAEVTMGNAGEGMIEGGNPFVYAIYINETEVFTNSDSYSELLPGDSFSFSYPIPYLIYNYPNSGTVRVIVDTQNSIKELDENNNEISVDYNF